jgi:hypothetical protein
MRSQRSLDGGKIIPFHADPIRKAGWENPKPNAFFNQEGSFMPLSGSSTAVCPKRILYRAGL